MKEGRRVDLLIVGAGAAGLSCGYYAKKKNLNYLIVEKGPSAGTAWLNMPENIYLLSPWYVNRLPGSSLDRFKIFKQHGCREFGGYLINYVDEHGLNIKYDSQVTGVKTNESGYLVTLKKGENIQCSYFINATGYFYNPNYPKEKSTTLASIPSIHVQTFQSAEKLSKRFEYKYNNILIIGSRISGGQTATELAKHGFGVTVSARTPITFAQEPWLQKLVYLPYYVYEWWLSRLKPKFLEDTSPPMEAGETRQLIESGAIKTQPGIQEVEGQKVTFTNGESEDFDLIVYCTGFNYVNEHLKEIEEARVKHDSSQTFFFMGKDLEYTARSRYLRGIREDAKRIIQKIRSSAK